VRRSGAREGDGLWVTGYWVARPWRSSTSAPAAHAGRLAQPLRLSGAAHRSRMWLASHGASAMIDISDGLAADAQHLAAASEVGIEINLEHIPCWENVAPLRRSPRRRIRVTMQHAADVVMPASPLSARRPSAVEPDRFCLRGAGGRRAACGCSTQQAVSLPAGYDHFA